MVVLTTIGYPLLGYRKGSLIKLSLNPLEKRLRKTLRKESLIDKSTLLEKSLIPKIVLCG